MTNRLAKESSLYLQQHQENPVDWFPWGPEALERARELGRPILLSVGYSACHWCHVMERESFEDAATAALINANFVAIKVDREERPDVDHLYMAACQLFTGSGGWPLTVFLTPDLRPFFAGTYFPKEPSHRRPSFQHVLQSLATAYSQQPEEIEEQAQRFHEALKELGSNPERNGAARLDAAMLEQAAAAQLKRVDKVDGGFGNAPKFPNTLELLVLQSAARRGDSAAAHAASLTCQRMAAGGMHDQLGGGFHRYSTDDQWLIPHFEKMLYDNALLPRVYLAEFRRTGDTASSAVARGVFGYVAREMTSPEGAFHASQDADSDGAEGRFFSWTPDQLESVLGKQMAALAAHRYGVTEQGNFEHGSSVLHLAASVEDVARRAGMDVDAAAAALEQARETLWRARELRIHPARDGKVVASWNGLMCSALADGAATLGDAALLEQAVRALRFILASMRRPDGGLWRVFAAGKAHISGLLEDHACVAAACLDVYRAGGGTWALQAATELCATMVTRFHDDGGAGFFSSEAGDSTLLVRAKSNRDGAIPAGGWVAAQTLARVGNLVGRAPWVRMAEAMVESHWAEFAKRPALHPSMTLLLEELVLGLPVVVVSGRNSAPLLAHVRARAAAGVAVVDAQESAGVVDATWLAGKEGDGTAAAYVCAGQTCQPAARSNADVDDTLRRAGLLG